MLTVLGSAHDARHGRTSLGGTAERVLHGAARAVAVIPRGYGERPLRAIGVGLLPTDESLRALRVGAALARAARAPLLVLTVLRRSPDPADAAGSPPGSRPRCRRSRGPAAEHPARGDRGRGARGRTGALAVEPRVLVGDAADALLRASARLDLLVLGSRAYGPPGVVLPGGAARQVLGGARCPVMLVPRAEVAAHVPVGVAATPPRATSAS